MRFGRASTDDSNIMTVILKAFRASKFDGHACIWLLIDDQHCAFVTVVGIGKLMWIACCWLDQMQPISYLELRWGLESIDMISSLQ